MLYDTRATRKLSNIIETITNDIISESRIDHLLPAGDLESQIGPAL